MKPQLARRDDGCGFIGHGSMNRGFVYSLDSMLALFCAFFLVLLSFSQLSLVDFSDNTATRSLLLLSESGLTVMEKSGLLSSAIASSNGSSLNSFLNAYPTSICASVRVFPFDDLATVSLMVVKSGCEGSTARLTRSYRLVPVWQDQMYRFYRVTLELWEV